jgi:hypothetical protein
MKVIVPKFPRRKPKRVVSNAQKAPWYMPKPDVSPEPRYDIMLSE